MLRQNARMQYLVAVALLVALAAWMVGVYNQLAHLRGQALIILKSQTRPKYYN